MIIELNETHEHYPSGLQGQTGKLYARGNTALLLGLEEYGVTVSGARASTGYGEHVTMEIVTGLVERGITLVSGAAYGIEGMALRAALAAGSSPVVLLAGGVDRYYPSGHETLLNRVLEAGGLIVSVAQPGDSPTRERFKHAAELKGRISAATLITEAGINSGSLGVAEGARYWGNKVYGVPGPVTSAASAGVHELIKTGVAHLATHSNDIEL